MHTEREREMERERERRATKRRRRSRGGECKRQTVGGVCVQLHRPRTAAQLCIRTPLPSHHRRAAPFLPSFLLSLPAAQILAPPEHTVSASLSRPPAHSMLLFVLLPLLRIAFTPFPHREAESRAPRGPDLAQPPNRRRRRHRQEMLCAPRACERDPQN